MKTATIRFHPASILILSVLTLWACGARRGASPSPSPEAAPSAEAALPATSPSAAYVCVAPGGAPGASGSPEAPLASVAEALELARRTGAAEVRLAAGSWTENLAPSVSVKISGGWNASFTARAGRSSIRAGQAMGARLPAAAIAAKGVKVILNLEGLELSGADKTNSAGLLLTEGAQAFISDCALSGGPGAASQGIALYQMSRAQISDSSIDGGSGAVSVGLSANDASARLYRCRITAGRGSVESYGLRGLGATLALHSSTVDGGQAASSHAVALDGCADVLLSRSTLWGGTGASAFALISAWSSPTLEGCVLGAAGRDKCWAVYENLGDSNPDMLSLCAFIPTTGKSLYWDDNERVFNELNAEGNFVSGQKELSSPPSWGNILWKGGSLGPDLSTPASAPLALRQAGLGHEDSATDITGKPRTDPWSMGAWEVDQ